MNRVSGWLFGLVLGSEPTIMGIVTSDLSGRSGHVMVGVWDKGQLRQRIRVGGMYLFGGVRRGLGLKYY